MSDTKYQGHPDQLEPTFGRIFNVHAPITDAQYTALLALFNECNEDFWLISQGTRAAFFDRLYSKG